MIWGNYYTKTEIVILAASIIGFTMNVSIVAAFLGYTAGVIHV